jgi:alkylation response protein AidB-like acyl-CoA dehydrogenase
VPDISLVDLARERGRLGDPQIRQELMKLHCDRVVNDWNGERAKAVMKAGGSSPLASLGKLAMAQILACGRSSPSRDPRGRSHFDGDQFPVARDANYSQLNAYFYSIGGGTDQIQRNIIGERILGLPREPEVDRDLPFRDVRAS